MMRCAAIDDEPLALKQITGYIERTPFLQLAAAYPGAIEAAGALAADDIDLLFIDIDMPGLSGLEFVRSLARKPMVVFTTAYSEFAVEGFRLDATDYLLKPIGYADFLRAAEKAYRQFRLSSTPPPAEQEAGRLFVKSEYKSVPVDLSRISHIESMGEYIRIFTDGQKPVMTLGSIRSMAEKLPAETFMRVHRSYLVNLRRIAAVERGVIITADGTRIPVGDQYKEDFRNFLERNSFSK